MAGRAGERSIGLHFGVISVPEEGELFSSAPDFHAAYRKDPAAFPVFERRLVDASEQIGLDLRAAALADWSALPAQLQRQVQFVLFTAIAEALRRRFAPRPVTANSYSIGTVVAFSFAGVLSLEAGLVGLFDALADFVKAHRNLGESASVLECALRFRPGVAAVPAVSEQIRELGLSQLLGIKDVHADDQVLVGGHRAELPRLIAALEARHDGLWKTIPRRAFGAHYPVLPELDGARDLAKLPFAAPDCRLITPQGESFEAGMDAAPALRRALARSLSAPMNSARSFRRLFECCDEVHVVGAERSHATLKLLAREDRRRLRRVQVRELLDEGPDGTRRNVA